jgi:hypothetical protein
MDLITSTDPRYDEARTVFNAMIDKRPAVIGQCATPADVREALMHGRAQGYEVAVRPMKDITVDPAARTVRVGAGVV